MATTNIFATAVTPTSFIVRQGFTTTFVYTLPQESTFVGTPTLAPVTVDNIRFKFDRFGFINGVSMRLTIGTGVFEVTVNSNNYPLVTKPASDGWRVAIQSTGYLALNHTGTRLSTQEYYGFYLDGQIIGNDYQLTLVPAILNGPHRPAPTRSTRVIVPIQPITF